MSGYVRVLEMDAEDRIERAETQAVKYALHEVLRELGCFEDPELLHLAAPSISQARAVEIVNLARGVKVL